MVTHLSCLECNDYRGPRAVRGEPEFCSATFWATVGVGSLFVVLACAIPRGWITSQETSFVARFIRKARNFFFFFNRKLLEFSKTRHPSILPPFLPSSQLSVSLLAMVTVAVGPASIETVFLWQRERGWKGTLARAQGQLLWEA